MDSNGNWVEQSIINSDEEEPDITPSLQSSQSNIDQETWNRVRNIEFNPTWNQPVTSASLASFHRPSESGDPEAMRVYMNNFRGDRPPLLTVDEMNDEREERGQARIPVSFPGLGGYTTNGLSLQEYLERNIGRTPEEIRQQWSELRPLSGVSRSLTTEEENNIQTLPNPFGLTSQDDLEAFERFRTSIIANGREAQEELARSTTQATLNTFHRAGSSVSNGMDRVREVLQGPSTLASLNQLQPEKQLHELSYETLTKQLYGLPVIIPEFLIVNGLRLEFIPFSDINTIQIERYIIEPLLQPWAGPPSTQNRILTIFDKNGMTHLVKAKYDQTSSQVFSPV